MLRKKKHKLFRGLLITLAAASSATASGSSVASASASLRDRSRVQPAQVFVIQHHSPQLLQTFATLVFPPARHNQSWHVIQHHHIILGMYTVCFTKIFSSGTAKTHFICSSLLLGWCFSFCNVFRSGFLAMKLRNRMSSWVSWVSFNSTNTHHYTYIYNPSS